MTQLQWLSLFSVGLFIYVVGCALLVFFGPLSRRWVRRLCISGMGALGLLSLNCSLLYVWHHFLR